MALRGCFYILRHHQLQYSKTPFSQPSHLLRCVDFIFISEGWILDNRAIDSYYASLFAKLNHRRDSWITGGDFKSQPLRKRWDAMWWESWMNLIGYRVVRWTFAQSQPHISSEVYEMWVDWRDITVCLRWSTKGLKTREVCSCVGFSVELLKKKTLSGCESPLAQRGNETAFLVHDLICQTDHFPGKSVCISPTSSFHLSVVIFAP